MKFRTFKTIITIVFFSSIVVVSSCKKDFLEAKPSTTLLQLHSINDMQQLLSNADVFNLTGTLKLAATDEYTIPDYTLFQSLLQQISKNSYTWEKDLYGGQINIPDWNIPYAAVFYSNNVLEALPTLSENGSDEWRRTKGWALFSRAFAFYELAQDFCVTYDSNTSASDKGIPLRLKPGIDELLSRSTLKQTYDQLLSDLQQAGSLLTNDISPIRKNEPSRAAVFALLSRVYLSMRDYRNAEISADSCLSVYKKLIDYNTVSKTSTSPFSFSNDEIIYYSTQASYLSEVISSTTGKYTISQDLLNLYKSNDLRFLVFFSKAANSNIVMKRGYSGKASVFTGLATDEIYLIKAECCARRNDIQASAGVLNSLLINRYVTGTFIPVNSSDKDELMKIILDERKKELIRRGLRWSDLKRLNKEGGNIILTRSLNGKNYTLLPNDSRYVFPIPNDEINYSGIEQNIR